MGEEALDVGQIPGDLALDLPYPMLLRTTRLGLVVGKLVSNAVLQVQIIVPGVKGARAACEIQLTDETGVPSGVSMDQWMTQAIEAAVDAFMAQVEARAKLIAPKTLVVPR